MEFLTKNAKTFGHGRAFGGLHQAPGPRAYRLLVAHQVAERCFGQHLINRLLHGAPQRADRAIYAVGAKVDAAGMVFAEAWFVQASTQSRQSLTDDDLVSGARQRVPTCLAARAPNEGAASKDTHQLGNVMVGNAF